MGFLFVHFPPSIFSLREHPCAPGAVNTHYFSVFFFFFLMRHIEMFIHSVIRLRFAVYKARTTKTTTLIFSVNL